MGFEHTVTRHGAPLYVFRMPHVQSIAVGVLVWGGTRDEIWPQEAGIFHALEHMLHKGNKRLPNSAAIAEEIELCGGNLNAFTDKEVTFYHRLVPDNALGLAVRSLASQVTDPLFRKADIVNEMQNVVHEIRMTYDEPMSFCQSKFEEVVYGRHPLGREILGTEESVLALRQGDFMRVHRRFYHPANYVFLVVGNTTMRRAKAVFDQADFGPPSSRRKNVRTAKRGAVLVERKTFERDIQQAHVSLGVLMGAASDLDSKALDVFSDMLSAGMSFPLFQEVRDKRSLCYTVYAAIKPCSDCGVFEIYLGTDAARIGEALECIHQVILESVEDEALFEKARKLLLGRNRISFTSPSRVLMHAVSDMIFEGEPKSPDEIRAEIGRQTFAGVQTAVERYLLEPAHYSHVYVVPTGAKV